jgi:hypothetical protein
MPAGLFSSGAAASRLYMMKGDPEPPRLAREQFHDPAGELPDRRRPAIAGPRADIVRIGKSPPSRTWRRRGRQSWASLHGGAPIPLLCVVEEVLCHSAFGTSSSVS